MSDNKQNFPLLRPYDTTLEDNIPMYDKLPYQRDADLCNKDSLRLTSGNIIKSFTYHIEDPIQIDNMDHVITYKIAPTMNENHSGPDFHEGITEGHKSSEEDEVSSQQMDKLLGDSTH